MASSRKNSKRRTSKQNHNYRIKSKYGLLPEDYDFILTRQEFKCSICKQEAKLMVDHNHATGVVRGLLCHQCNIGLGNFKDDEKLLEEAIRYLNGGYFKD